jgi:hypothetical protein
MVCPKAVAAQKKLRSRSEYLMVLIVRAHLLSWHDESAKVGKS